MAVTHRETERKYEATSDTEMPSWAALFGEGQPHTEDQQLVATYFDTPDLRLASAAITMRHRTGDDEAGWHVKLPAGEGSRDELQVPDPPGSVPNGDPGLPPAEFVDLLRAFTGGADLAPIASLRTHRTMLQWKDDGGRALLVVTDDRVTARVLPDGTDRSWREFEVELGAHGDLDLLDRADTVLRKAGVRPSKSASKLARALGPRLPRQPEPPGKSPSAGDVVLAYLRAQVAAIRRSDLEVRRDTDDAVHQLRVSARRARSALQAFGTVLDRDRVQPLVEELRWLGEAAGRARDLEVLRERLVAELAALPTEDALGPVHARVTRWFAPREAQARSEALTALNSERHGALLAALDAVLVDPPTLPAAGRKADAVLRRELRHAHRRVERHLKAAAQGDAGRDVELHEARKAGKRLRYAAEAVGSSVPGTKALVMRTKQLQDLLGEHQDAVVAVPVLRELAVAAHGAGENGYPFGLLAGRALARGVDERALADAAAAVRKAAGKLK